VYERRFQPLLPRKAFARRLRRSAIAFALLLACALSVGVLGYHFVAHLAWIDALLNASMILSGMGPLHHPASVGGKMFSALYALYSGFAVLAIAGIIFAPVVHRVFHRFHIDEAGSRKK